MISIAAAAFSWQSFIIAESKLSFFPTFPLLLFAATFSFYGLHDFVTKVRSKAAIHSEKKAFWIKHYRKLIFPWILCVFIMTYILVELLTIKEFIFFLVAGLLTLFYSFRIIPLGKIKRWKDHAILKILALAGIWTLATIIGLEKFLPQKAGLIASLFLFRLLFMLLICIPFDVRDQLLDSLSMKTTLVQQFGIQKLQYLSYLLTGLAIAVLFLAVYAHLLSLLLGAALGIHLLVVTILSVGTICAPEKHFNYLWLDAQMIVQSIIVGACVWLA